MRSRIGMVLSSASLVLGLALTACSSSQRTTTTSPAPASARAESTATESGWPSRRTNETMAWSARAYPTGDRRTSAIGIEKGYPTEVRVNDDFNYQIVVTNLTNDDLSNVMLRDLAGENLKIKSSEPKAQVDGSVATWQLGDLGPRQSRTVNITATASKEGITGSCAEVLYDSMLCATVPVVAPKLMLTKTGPAEVLKCEEITYVLEVTNSGTGSIPSVRIEDPLPDGMNTVDGQKALSINVGPLAAGQSKRYNAKVVATRTGKFTNAATAKGGDLTAKSGEVVTTVRAPKLTIEKDCPKTEFIGRPIEYKLTVKNTGDGEARETIVEDRLPAGATGVTASDRGAVAGGVVRWALGTLRPNESRTMTVRLTPGAAGVLRNTAMASAFCADQVTDSCETTITGIPAILLEVVDLQDPVQVGGNTTYVITVTNQGSAPGTNIKLVCNLEANQEFVSATGATRGSGRGATITFDALATLAPKEKATFQVVVRNVKAGDVRFRTSMTSDQLTREVIETEATNVYE